MLSYRTEETERKIKQEQFDTKFGLMEILAGNINMISDNNNNHHIHKNISKAQLYKNKICLPIIESIIMENGQFLCWLFTDGNGYVMKRSSKKLSKDYIIIHFINQLKQYCLSINDSLDVTNEKFLNDLKAFSSSIDQTHNKAHLFKDIRHQYLLRVDKMKFLYVYFTESLRNNFINLLEFVKLLNDSNKINTILLVQNFITLHSFSSMKIENELMLNREKVRYLIVKFKRKGEMCENGIDNSKLCLYYNKPKLLEKIDCEFKEATLKRALEKERKRKESMSDNNKEDNIDEIKSDNDDDLIMINNENLIHTINKIISPFIKLIENKKMISITSATFTFVKVKDMTSQDGNSNYYSFQHCERLIGIPYHSQSSYIKQQFNKTTMNNIFSKHKPVNMIPIKTYEKITHDAFCFGEFCDYIIPQYFKNIRRNNKIDEMNKLLIPSLNRFTSRDKNHNLPYSLPVFQIKKAHDNPHLVNVVLKAYSIFPKNFDKDYEMAKIIKERKEEEERRKHIIKENNEKQKARHKEWERNHIKAVTNCLSTNSDNNNNKINELHEVLPSVEFLGLNTSFESELNEIIEVNTQNKKASTIILYTPKPNKFTHLNYDEMYKSQYICENCFKIYTLLYNFFSNINETTSQFKSLSKARDILLQGENLNLNINLFEDPNQIGNEENLLFQEEIHEISLKKMIKKNIIRERLEVLNHHLKKEKVKIGRNTKTKMSEFDNVFDYKLDINPRLLKLNLVAEKSKNKFFKLIFNELRAAPETLYQKLCIQKPQHEGASTMKALRMHMGINSHIYNPDLTSIKIPGMSPDDEAEYLSNLKQTLDNKEMHLNTQRENNQVDNDLFLTYKNYLKKLKVNHGEYNEDYENEEHDNNINSKELEPIDDNPIQEIYFSEEDSDAYDEGDNSNIRNIIQDDYIQPRFSLIKGSPDKKEKKYSVMTDLYSKSFKRNYLGTIDGSDNQNETSLLKFSDNNNNNKTPKQDTQRNSCRVIRSEIRSKTVMEPQRKTATVYSLPRVSRKSLIKRAMINDDKNLSKSTSNLPFMSNQIKKDREKKLEYIEKIKNIQMKKDKKLKQFLYIAPGTKSKEPEAMNPMMPKDQSKKKNNKKITLSVMINERTCPYKSDVPFYYISSPLPKFNEGSIPVKENPLVLTQNIKWNEYLLIGKFKQSTLLSSCEIFVYDTNTAIPFKVVNMKYPLLKSSNINLNTTPKQKHSSTPSTPPMHRLTEEKIEKLFIVVLNDFFDSYDKYQDEISDICRIYADKVKELKCVFFNFPGQSSTMWSKKNVLNNMYYSTFLDRFLFYLAMKGYFDQSYGIIFLGFGNGGNIALTYTSFYEKYWDFIHSIIMLNSFCDNDTFLNQSMVEILKIVNGSKNHKLVDFFIKSVTINPQTLINLNIDKGIDLGGDETNPITLAGYHSITKGYFFNMKINHKEIKTRILAAHSNQNCFVSINNLNALFCNQIISYAVTQGEEIPMQKYFISLNNENKEGWKPHDEMMLDTTTEGNNNNYYNKTTKGSTYRNVKTEQNMNRNYMNTNTSNASAGSKSGNGSRKGLYLEYDLKELLAKGLKRKLIVIEGSHDIKYNDAPCISNILSSFLKFIITKGQFEVNH